MPLVLEAFRYSRYGYGDGPFHLDDLQCSGDEESLFNCPHSGVGIHDCGRYHDVSASCSLGKAYAMLINKG